ncbi:MAG: TaqI family restriction endonuclease [Endomicrobium sp.]|nr:TaqI family restriction endonuclease [Endomicrobium sp.]
MNLYEYREKYSRIKIVEMDLPKSIQALRSIYYYWKNAGVNIPDFERYYNLYYEELKDEIEAFRKKRECVITTLIRD